MEVSLSALRKVEVDDDVHSLDVDTSGEEIYRKENVIRASNIKCVDLKRSSIW